MVNSICFFESFCVLPQNTSEAHRLRSSTLDSPLPLSVTERAFHLLTQNVPFGNFFLFKNCNWLQILEKSSHPPESDWGCGHPRLRTTVLNHSKSKVTCTKTRITFYCWILLIYRCHCQNNLFIPVKTIYH